MSTLKLCDSRKKNDFELLAPQVAQSRFEQCCVIHSKCKHLYEENSCITL